MFLGCKGKGMDFNCGENIEAFVQVFAQPIKLGWQ